MKVSSVCRFYLMGRGLMDKIGNVSINYEFYSGEDSYSDGDIEFEMLEYIKNEKDVMKILEKDSRWPVLYHFSPVRRNILDWYPFKKDAKVLEIGSGCGAITGAICRKAASVTCVDLSKTRSLINAHRNSEFDNLEIVVGNFNDVKLEEKYDYITLIGVLEYAAYYTPTENPFVDFLRKIKGYMKEDGKLLIAIENKYGMKYFSGSYEDHTGVMFDGIEGYKNTSSAVRTFSKKELCKMLREAGLNRSEFYYPFPDYKFPDRIYSDEFMPDSKELICSMDCYDKTGVRIFNETAATNAAIEAGMFDVFSNSFFIEAGVGEQ